MHSKVYPFLILVIDYQSKEIGMGVKTLWKCNGCKANIY
ncbi:hypothetical protein EVA_15067 [gut metagenome]|uniref:Uncharacterized protein n=1 Tax=gut metagenome TaxID=749906 RepID=J9CA70_9ZZZZ